MLENKVGIYIYIYIYVCVCVCVSMVFKEGFSSHYQEKIARHSHLLQASEQCFCKTPDSPP